MAHPSTQQAQYKTTDFATSKYIQCIDQGKTVYGSAVKSCSSNYYPTGEKQKKTIDAASFSTAEVGIPISNRMSIQANSGRGSILLLILEWMLGCFGGNLGDLVTILVPPVCCFLSFAGYFGAQSCSDRDVMGLKVEQIDNPKPLELDGVGIRSGSSPSGPLPTVDNALGRKLRPDSEFPSCHSFGSDENSLESAKAFQEESLSAVGMFVDCPLHIAAVFISNRRGYSNQEFQHWDQHANISRGRIDSKEQPRKGKASASRATSSKNSKFGVYPQDPSAIAAPISGGIPRQRKWHLGRISFLRNAAPLATSASRIHNCISRDKTAS
ncbi:hypothetical protein Nepgr_033714 [Nepenthes gracilis]|uniref:Uncharacterized protein n=1 Tax=Nepenthes gracilis TaxID=150966 RepID=A0AAD3TLN9_NEPGR|nr:hypothetical protein Nepgr_033714 [Nepenthes gracilis]